jgi:hypothetical protein
MKCYLAISHAKTEWISNISQTVVISYQGLLWCPLFLPRFGPVGAHWAVPGIHSPETKINVHHLVKIQVGHCIYFARTTGYMVQSVKEGNGIWLLHNDFNIDMVFSLNQLWYPATSMFQQAR